MAEINVQIFQIQLHVNFGDSVYIYGAHDEMGSWKRELAARMEWNEGDLWKVGLHLPVEGFRRIEYGYFVASTEDPTRLRVLEGGPNRVAVLRTGENLIADRWEQYTVNIRIKLPRTLLPCKEVLFRVKTGELSEWFPSIRMTQVNDLDSSVTYEKLLPFTKFMNKIYISFLFVRRVGGKDVAEYDKDGEVKLDIPNFLKRKGKYRLTADYLNLEGNVICFNKVFLNEFCTYRVNCNIMLGPRPTNKEEWRLVAEDCSQAVLFSNEKSPDETAKDPPESKRQGELINNYFELNSLEKTKNGKKSLKIRSFNVRNEERKEFIKNFSQELIAIFKAEKNECIFIAWDNCKHFVTKSMIYYISLVRKMSKPKAEAMIRNYTMLKSLPDKIEG